MAPCQSQIIEKYLTVLEFRASIIEYKRRKYLLMLSISCQKGKTNLSTPKPWRLYINGIGSQCLQANYGSNDLSTHAES